MKKREAKQESRKLAESIVGARVLLMNRHGAEYTDAIAPWKKVIRTHMDGDSALSALVSIRPRDKDHALWLRAAACEVQLEIIENPRAAVSLAGPFRSIPWHRRFANWIRIGWWAWLQLASRRKARTEVK